MLESDDRKLKEAWRGMRRRVHAAACELTEMGLDRRQCDETVA
jgi:hypothetical protein